MSQLDPSEFIITRKRKKYKFALYNNHPLCFEVDEWKDQSPATILEIGAGTGLFAVELAAKFPDRQVLAIDVKADRLITGAKLASERGLTNIRFLRAHVDQLHDVIPPQSVEKLWVTFSDPFPKERYAKHRLTHPRFLAFYKTVLRPHGLLYFKTDAKNLFTWSLEQFVREGWRIEMLYFDLHESDAPSDYKIMTTYETRFVNKGLPIYFLEASCTEGDKRDSETPLATRFH